MDSRRLLRWPAKRPAGFRRDALPFIPPLSSALFPLRNICPLSRLAHNGQEFAVLRVEKKQRVIVTRGLLTPSSASRESEDNARARQDVGRSASPSAHLARITVLLTRATTQRRAKSADDQFRDRAPSREIEFCALVSLL